MRIGQKANLDKTNSQLSARRTPLCQRWGAAWHCARHPGGWPAVPGWRYRHHHAASAHRARPIHQPRVWRAVPLPGKKILCSAPRDPAFEDVLADAVLAVGLPGLVW